MKKVILFDMDGTLTEPRQTIKNSMINALIKLQKNKYEIAILSGSDMDYIEEQCNLIFEPNQLDWTKLHYLPCNGTKYYQVCRQTNKFKLVYELDMKKEIGEKKYNSIICALLAVQKRFIEDHPSISYTGTFIQNRKSMINYCPIGRSATVERKLWEKENKENILRKEIKNFLSKDSLKDIFSQITIKLGGETSFDIYPIGWDKSYAWNVFKDFQEIYFVGDRCLPEGNDYEAYIKAGSRGYETEGPTQTIKIISEILRR
jgi:phosphomannomutase